MQVVHKHLQRSISFFHFCLRLLIKDAGVKFGAEPKPWRPTTTRVGKPCVLACRPSRRICEYRKGYEAHSLLCRTLLHFWFSSTKLGQHPVPQPILVSLCSFFLCPILLLLFFQLLGTDSLHLSFLHDKYSSVSAKSYPFLVPDDICVARFNDGPLSIN